LAYLLIRITGVVCEWCQ